MEHVAQAVVGACEISLARQERGVLAGKAVEHVDEHAVHAERLHLGGNALHVQRRGFLHKRPVIEAVLVVVVPQPEVRRAGERCDVRILLRLLRESPHAPLRLPPGAVLPCRLSNRAREEETHPAVTAPSAAVVSPPRDARRIRRIGAADDFATQRVLHPGHRPHPGAGNAEEAHRRFHAVAQAEPRSSKHHLRVAHGIRHAFAERQDEIVAFPRRPSGRIREGRGHRAVRRRGKDALELSIRRTRPHGLHRTIPRHEL